MFHLSKQVINFNILQNIVSFSAFKKYHNRSEMTVAKITTAMLMPIYYKCIKKPLHINTNMYITTSRVNRHHYVSILPPLQVDYDYEHFTF